MAMSPLPGLVYLLSKVMKLKEVVLSTFWEDRSCKYGVLVQSVVLSKNFNNGALGTTTPIFWVWSSYNHAHIFKDGNMIIYFNNDIV